MRAWWLAHLHARAATEKASSRSPEQSRIRLTILFGAIMRHSLGARFVKNRGSAAACVLVMASPLACAGGHGEHVIASPEQSQIRLIMLFGAIMRHFVKARFVKK